MSIERFPQIAVAICLLAFCTGCAEMEDAARAANNAARTAAASFAPTSGYWNAEGMPGHSKIVVSLGDQQAYFYKGKRLVGQSTISTGRKGYETPPGKYRVIQK